ncbi:MAG: CAAD domain-containing protein [Synechococcus sp.]
MSSDVNSSGFPAPAPLSTPPTTSAAMASSPSPEAAAPDTVTPETVAPETASESSLPSDPVASAETVAPSDAVIAERITIPANPSHGDDSPKGGEWDLLTAKVSAWWERNNVAEQISGLRQPLLIFGYLIGAILILKVYGGLLAAIGSIPLASGLFELVGVCWLVRFSSTRLVRNEDRAEVIQDLRQRWSAFTGKS